jgi:hypothetical protein
MRMHVLFAFAFAIAVTSLASLGCSSSSADGATAADTGGSGLPPNVTAVRCYDAAKKTCDIKGESSASAVDSANASCTAKGGMPVAACPASGLQGCCVIVGLGSCTYDATAVAGLKSACPLGGAVWTATAP